MTPAGRLARTLLSGLALGALAAAAKAEGSPPQLQPVQMVRSLQLVQDRVAAGDHAALPMQRKLLEMIDARLRKSTKEELSEEPNFRATLVYAMSGGNPATLEHVLERLDLDEASSRKAIGILTYLKGGTKAASIALKSVDPMQESPELGSFVALVKGSLLALEDRKAALALLDQARLLSPGTLVEEAALRRSIPLAAESSDAARLLLASEQYVRVYLRSPYASQFADSFVAGVVHLQETIDLDAVAQIISLMTPEQQHVIYLRLARRAAIDGLSRLSAFAAERTTIPAPEETGSDDPRALLYASLASATTAPLEELRARLARIDRARLSPGDLQLLDAVTLVTSQMTGEVASAPVEASTDDPADEPRVIASPVLDPGIPETADPLPGVATAAAEPAPAETAPAETAKAEQEEATPAQQAAVASGEANAEAATPVTAAESGTAAPSPDDAAHTFVVSGRQKLEEIDALLAKAKK